MAEKNSEVFCVIDHANKKADRERANPNRKNLRSLRAWGGVPEDTADAAAAQLAPASTTTHSVVTQKSRSDAYVRIRTIETDGD